MGNDDNSPTNGMTGGTLPARTWHTVMAYAHQGLEPKPLPYQPAEDDLTALTAARAKTLQAQPAQPGPPRPQTLSRRSLEVIDGIEKLLAQPAEARQLPSSPTRILELDDGRMKLSSDGLEQRALR
jgi:penicillin-binding protein 1A